MAASPFMFRAIQRSSQRSKQRHWLAALLACSVALLSACGGGGSSSGSEPDPSLVTPGTATISGVADFESVASNTTSGALNYSAISVRPIRGATIEAVSVATGVVLATGVTSSTGAFTLSFSGVRTVILRAKAQLVRSGSTGGTYDFAVRDNTASNGLYALDSAAFRPNVDTPTSQNLRAGTGWGGSSYSGARSAAPFSILDVVYDATQKILSASPNITLPPLTLFWSVNNRPVPATATAGLAQGNIGTSFFQSGSTGRNIYILGAENTDTDEFDRHVIAHEFGHYMQDAFSRDDSVGGSHSGGDRLDMRVAFSEGWGNAWSGMALGGSRYYADSTGTRQGSGFILDLNLAPTSNTGWYSEASVQYLLGQWANNAAIGFTPIFNVLSAMPTSLPADGALSSIHSFASRLKAAVPAAASSIDSSLAGQSITVNSAIGAGETNDGGVAEALPIYRTHTAALGANQSYCLNSTASTSGSATNKLGTNLYIRFTLSAASAGARTIRVNAITTPTLSDPDFELYKSDGSQAIFQAGGAGVGETGTTNLSAGTHVIVLYDYELKVGSGQRCFNLSIS